MRRSIVISVVMVLCVLGLLLFGFGTQTEVPAAPPGPVVLLVEDNTGAFLLQVKQGAQQAAAQAGCTLTQEPLSGKTLAETAQRWSQRKATAALLLTEDAVLRAEAEAALDAVGVPVVVLRDEETRTVYATMDERQAGMLLADFAKAYGRVYLVGDAQMCIRDSVLSNLHYALGIGSSCVLHQFWITEFVGGKFATNGLEFIEGAQIVAFVIKR